MAVVRLHLCILPPTYHYPYNLQDQIQENQRATVLNDLVSITYEGRVIQPAVMMDIEIREPIRTWLAARSSNIYPDLSRCVLIQFSHCGI